MRSLIWLLRIVLLLLLFGLAAKNSGLVDLRLYFDSVWQAPLSLVVLVCFVAGVALGVSVAVFARVRQRREIQELRKQLAATIPGGGSPR